MRGNDQKNTMTWIKDYTLSWFQLLVLNIVKTGHIPKHVAFIMDGNRRYANKQRMDKVEGHTKGFDRLTEVLYWCSKLNVTEVTVYAFSIENFKRPKEEIDGLMALVREKFERLLEEKDKLMEHGICVRIIGNVSLISKDIRILIAKVMVMTKRNNKSYLNIAFAYTSRDEVTYAVKSIAEGVKHTEILLEDITDDLISDCLYTYNSSNPDLLIRTSGEVRLSDFLMWQISNACVYFTDVLWPEFSVWNFLGAIFYYQRCYSDLKKIAKVQTPKSIESYNDRVFMYISKLHNERQAMLENVNLPATPS